MKNSTKEIYRKTQQFFKEELAVVLPRKPKLKLVKEPPKKKLKESLNIKLSRIDWEEHKEINE